MRLTDTPSIVTGGAVLAYTIAVRLPCCDQPLLCGGSFLSASLVYV